MKFYKRTVAILAVVMLMTTLIAPFASAWSHDSKCFIHLHSTEYETRRMYISYIPECYRECDLILEYENCYTAYAVVLKSTLVGQTWYPYGENSCLI